VSKAAKAVHRACEELAYIVASASSVIASCNHVYGLGDVQVVTGGPRGLRLLGAHVGGQGNGR
jgi:hypothetical protein